MNNLRSELLEFKRLRNIFNPFKVLDNAGREEVHSRVIAWLLNPEESHGCGDAFARALLPAAGAADLGDFARLIVEREKTIKLVGCTHNRKGRIDVIASVPHDGPVWILELKTYSDEHDNQLKNYREWCELKFNGRKLAYIYLTRDATAPSDSLWRAVGYRQLIDILDGIAPPDSFAHRFVMDYRQALQRWFLSGSPSQEKGQEILSGWLGGEIGRFPSELRDEFKDEYDSLLRIHNESVRALKVKT